MIPTFEQRVAHVGFQMLCAMKLIALYPAAARGSLAEAVAALVVAFAILALAAAAAWFFPEESAPPRGVPCTRR